MCASVGCSAFDGAVGGDVEDAGADAGSIPPVDAGAGADARSVPDGAVIWPENGHAYVVVVAPSPVAWTVAQDVAANMGGHLATIGSASENLFVWSVVRGTPGAFLEKHGPWLGGFQPADAGEPGEGWAWVTGEPWSFTAWGPSEPNDSRADEDFLKVYADTTDVTMYWDDGNRTTEDVVSFVVELE